MANEKDDKPCIESIKVFDDVKDDEFLQECFLLGTVAAGLVHIKDAIMNCKCENVVLIPIKDQFSKDYEKMIQSLKEGKLEEVFNEVKAYMLAYAAAHSTTSCGEGKGSESPFEMSGPLVGITKDDTKLN